MKDWTIEAGGKLILGDNYSNFETDNFNDSTEEYQADILQTNNFRYHQNIYSIYNSYQYKWNKWSIKAGLRLEHTTVNADFISEDSTIRDSYNNLIPSFFLQRELKNSSINLGFTNRISRPGIS